MDRKAQPLDAVAFRRATGADAAAIAVLHAESWRRTYRGAYADSYLDGPVFEDRATVWQERLARSSNHEVTIVAELGGTVVGFVHVILDRHPQLGAYVENLHVLDAARGRGVGTGLLDAAARIVVEHRPGSGVHLRVLEQNTAARGFYVRRGAKVAEHVVAGPFPGGGTAPALVVAWPDAAALLQEPD